MGKLLLVVWGSLHGHIIPNDSTQICWYANMTDAIFVPNSGKHKFGGDRYAVHENGEADIVSIRRDAGIVLPCGGDRGVRSHTFGCALVHGLLENVHDLLHVGAVLNLKQNDLVRRAGDAQPPSFCK